MCVKESEYERACVYVCLKECLCVRMYVYVCESVCVHVCVYLRVYIVYMWLSLCVRKVCVSERKKRERENA